MSDPVEAVLSRLDENTKKLQSCRLPHTFVPYVEHSGFVTQMQCAKCEGVVTSESARWYSAGIDHGVRSARVILWALARAQKNHEVVVSRRELEEAGKDCELIAEERDHETVYRARKAGEQ